jgi:hypothetical protein
MAIRTELGMFILPREQVEEEITEF